MLCCLLFWGDKSHFRDRNSCWGKSAPKVQLSTASSWAWEVFSPNPETPENFPAHWQGFCFGCFFPHLSFLLPCQISLVVEESLRLDCFCCSEPLTERLVGAFTSCSQGNILGATLCFASMVQTVQLLINEKTVWGRLADRKIAGEQWSHRSIYLFIFLEWCNS